MVFYREERLGCYVDRRMPAIERSKWSAVRVIYGSIKIYGVEEAVEREKKSPPTADEEPSKYWI